MTLLLLEAGPVRPVGTMDAGSSPRGCDNSAGVQAPERGWCAHRRSGTTCDPEPVGLRFGCAGHGSSRAPGGTWRPGRFGNLWSLGPGGGRRARAAGSGLVGHLAVDGEIE